MEITVNVLKAVLALVMV